MKNKINFFTGLLLGALTAGGVSTILYGKKLKEIQDMADKQIKMMEQYYKRVDTYVRVPEEEKIDEDVEDTRQHTIEEKERLKAVAKEEGYKDYTQMYKMEESTSEEISPDLEEAHKLHEENKNLPPKIITEEEAAQLPNTFDHVVIYYYTYNDVATDEENHVMNNPELLYGTVLDDSDFLDDEEQDTLLIVNYAHDTLYEICKINAEYVEEH